MTDADLIKRLESEVDFTNSIATAFVRAHAHCEYCGQDLLRDRLGYASLGLDHLLPQSKHNPFITDQPANWVASCSCCNSAKGDYSVLQPGEDAEDMLSAHRSDLIDRAKQYIQEKMRDYDSKWRLATEILESTWWSRDK